MIYVGNSLEFNTPTLVAYSYIFATFSKVSIFILLFCSRSRSRGKQNIFFSYKNTLVTSGGLQALPKRGKLYTPYFNRGFSITGSPVGVDDESGTKRICSNRNFVINVKCNKMKISEFLFYYSLRLKIIVPLWESKYLRGHNH